MAEMIFLFLSVFADSGKSRKKASLLKCRRKQLHRSCEIISLISAELLTYSSERSKCGFMSV